MLSPIKLVIYSACSKYMLCNLVAIFIWTMAAEQPKRLAHCKEEKLTYVLLPHPPFLHCASAAKKKGDGVRWDRLSLLHTRNRSFAVG